MTERRKNWKEEMSKSALERKQKRVDLLTQLDQTRREIQTCGLDFKKHDQLKARQREIIAQLATM